MLLSEVIRHQLGSIIQRLAINLEAYEWRRTQTAREKKIVKLERFPCVIIRGEGLTHDSRTQLNPYATIFFRLRGDQKNTHLLDGNFMLFYNLYEDGHRGIYDRAPCTYKYLQPRKGFFAHDSYYYYMFSFVKLNQRNKQNKTLLWSFWGRQAGPSLM